MAGSKTNYFEEATINTQRGTSFSVATVYLALFKADPTDAGTQTSEVTGGSYTRQAFTWTAPSGGSTSNSALISFPTATAPWGLITHVGVMDASSGGNMLLHAPLNQLRDITTTERLEIYLGDLVWTED